jgi:[ribosomal protein S5]-alanine N-acetyltransferase
VPTFSALPLSTERLVLRPLRQDDAGTLLTIYSDPAVMRYWGSPAWSKIEQAIAMIDRESKALDAGEYLRLGIERRADGVLIGACTLFSFHEDSRRAEIGYILESQSWGCGFMSESLAGLINYGFTELNLNRIEADIDPRNQRSETILQRLGFVKEGLLRQRWIVAGEVSNTALYGLLRDDWRKHAHENRPSGDA